MAKKLYEESSVSDIAVAIREKNGLSTTYNVSEMGDAVRAIPTNDTFRTQENRNSLATVLENVPIVADNADAAASINAIRNSFISTLRGGVTPAEPVLVSISVTPTSITVPSGTTASQVKDYLTSMTGHYETEGVSGQTTRDLTSELSSATVSGTMPTPGNTSTMTISYGGKSTTVSVTMEEAAPTLTGLTATYTGGTVAAGTTLSQLTEVVKATYSDGSTSAALTKDTDYTLSGVLTPGQTNTITVTGKGGYAGFTTTFSVTVEAAPGATSSGGTAQGTGSKTFSNIVQDNAVTNPTSITFTSQNETQPSGGANLCYKVILTKEGDNWTMAFYRFSAKNTPYPGETAHPYATVTISDGIVTAVTLPKFQFSDSVAANSYTANGYTYTMEVSS